MPNPNHENGQVGFNNAAAVTLTFTHRVAAFKVWSADDSFYLGIDEVADNTKWLVPLNTIDSNAIPCKYISLLGQTGAGIIHYMVIYQISGISDEEAQDNRGGIHIS